MDKERAASVRPLKKSVLVPGDVLPVSAGAVYTVAESDPERTESEEGSGDELVEDAPDQPIRGGKPGRVKIPKQPKLPRTKAQKPARIRPPGVMGTNVHSAVAGISTSNALALLSPPPPEAKPGSKYRPWFKLTDWEMARLRKLMKKNAIWSPSDTMIRRELDKDGRGRENYERAKALADAGGDPLIDENPIDPFKTELAPGEISYEQPKEMNELVNRGMRLNEAKKHKKEKEMQELEEANRRIAAAGDAFKYLFSTPPTPAVQQPSRAKKRKRDAEKETPPADKTGPSNPAQEGTKKIKLAPIAPKPLERRLAPKVTSPAKGPTAGTSTMQIPLAPAGASSAGQVSCRQKAGNTRCRRGSSRNKEGGVPYPALSAANCRSVPTPPYLRRAKADHACRSLLGSGCSFGEERGNEGAPPAVAGLHRCACR